MPHTFLSDSYPFSKQDRGSACQIQKIKEVYCPPKASIHLQDLDLRSQAYLGTLCSALLDESMETLYPCETIVPPSPPLCPTNRMRRHLYLHLIKSRAIFISPHSSLDTFREGSDFPLNVNLQQAIFKLNIKSANSKEQLIYDILHPKSYSSATSADVYQIWRDIALEECIQYIIYQLGKLDFTFIPDGKTITVFQSLLTDFSASQIYGIIEESIKNISRPCLYNHISRQYTSILVIELCEQYGEMAKRNGWNLRRRSRVSALPQSLLSEFFFNRVVCIGESGFDLPPALL